MNLWKQYSGSVLLIIFTAYAAYKGFNAIQTGEFSVNYGPRWYITHTVRGTPASSCGGLFLFFAIVICAASIYKSVVWLAQRDKRRRDQTLDRRLF